jgi:hypothetical protein
MDNPAGMACAGAHAAQLAYSRLVGFSGVEYVERNHGASV